MALRIPVAQNTQDVRIGPSGGLQAPDAGPGIGAGLQSVGAGLGQMADAQTYTQTLFDQAHVKQAVAAFQDAGRTALDTGPDAYYNKRGQDAIDAYEPTMKSLRDQRAQISKGLVNERQTRMFDEVADRYMGQWETGSSRYANQQAIQFHQQASQARQYQASQDAITYADDPDKLNASIGTIRLEAMSQATDQGLHGDAANVFASKAVSDAYDAVVQAKASSDPATAKRFYDLHRDQIEPTTQIKLDKMLEAPLLDQFADEQSDAIRGMGGFNPNPSAADLVAAVTGQETAGHNGLRSPKGALGVMQVMPGTAKDICKELGISFDPAKLRNDPAYCTKIGTAYLSKMLQRYGGNATLALAAYNAGPGRVDEWVDNIGDPRKGEITDAQFAQRIPIEETRNYVPGVLRRLGAGGSKNAPQQNDLNSQLAQVDTIAAAQGWTQKQIGEVKQQVIQKDALDQRLLAQGQKDAEDQAWNLVMPINGQAITDPTKVPPALWAKMSPEGQRSIRAVIKQNAKGEDPAPNPDLYYKLSTVAAANPKAFATMDLRPYAAQLPKSDWEQFNTLQRGAITQGERDPKLVAYSRLWGLSKDAFENAGFTTGAKAKPEDRAAQVTFMNKLVNEASSWQETHGKAPTDDDLIGIRDKLLLNVDQVSPGRLWGQRRTTVPLFQAQGQIQVPIPNAIKSRIIQSYQRTHNGANPSDQMISETYLRNKGSLW